MSSWSPGRRRALSGLALAAGAALVTAALAVPAAAVPTRPTPPTPPTPARPALPGVVHGNPQAAKERLDRKGAAAPANVTAWYVDETTGQVVVSVVGPPTPASAQFAADPDPAAVRQEPFAEPVRPLASLVGGNAIYNSRYRCSLGFNAYRGATPVVITAGHCTASGGPWSGYDRTIIGNVDRSVWPNRDYGTIVDSNAGYWTPTSQIAFTSNVLGSTESPTGSRVCRSGSTTGYRCGTITGKNITVNYGNGQLVYGLTRTNACAEAGDSGGSFVDPRTRQAQGLTSGGTGNCTVGGVTYFQPINPVLSALGLRLKVG